MNLENEKLNALNGEEDLNPKYDVDKEKLNKSNTNMKNISNIDKNFKSVDGIITKKRKQKDYEEIWNCFISEHLSDFTNHMGYGVDKILEIGMKKFIDYMDWRAIEDISSYRTDAVKVIPCAHCQSEFTTYQLDLGLCDKCKDKYELDKFNEICVATDEKNPGDSTGLVIMFVYFKEFRNLFNKDFSFKEKCLLCATSDDLAGIYSRDFILSFINNKDDISIFIDIISSNIDKLNSFARARFTSIAKILLDSENKVSRINFIF